MRKHEALRFDEIDLLKLYFVPNPSGNENGFVGDTASWLASLSMVGLVGIGRVGLTEVADVSDVWDGIAWGCRVPTASLLGAAGFVDAGPGIW